MLVVKTGAHAKRMKRVIIVYIIFFFNCDGLWTAVAERQQVLNCATKCDFVHLHTVRLYNSPFCFFFFCFTFILRELKAYYIFKWALKRMPAAFSGWLPCIDDLCSICVSFNDLVLWETIFASFMDGGECLEREAEWKWDNTLYVMSGWLFSCD